MAAALEGALAGSGVRQRLTALRMPRYSPPFTVWLLIGLVYYALCFIVLRQLLAAHSVTLASRVALALLLIVLLGNALWSVLFFRRRDLRASFIAFIPYSVVVPRWSSRSRAFIVRCCVVYVLLHLPAVCHVVGLSFVATQHPRDLTRRSSERFPGTRLHL